jgi:DoxX-like family
MLIASCQIIVALGLLNVWLVRFNRATAYRGGQAVNMLQEFAVYGLPAWFCYFVGFLKVASAGALLAGLFLTQLALPAASLIAVLMVGAVVMHLKVCDPLKKVLPALSVLLLSFAIIAAHWSDKLQATVSWPS